MNADRRQAGRMLIALLEECSIKGTIEDDSHVAATDTLSYLQQQEFWQLKSQSKYEGQNTTTDKQIAICRVALPALETALAAWNRDDFETVITQLRLAITTKGEAPKKTRKKGLRKRQA